MKTRYRISKIEGDIITLNNFKRYKAGPLDAHRLIFWHAFLDEVELSGSWPFLKMTKISGKQTISVTELH